MKHALILTAILFGTGARAQERVPDEEAQRIARLLTEASSKATLPVKLEVDASKPFAKRKDEYGAMVLPAKALKPDTTTQVGAEFTPIGHLWLKGLSPVVEDRPLSSKKLLIVPVTVKDQEHNLVLCSLGVQTIKERASLVVLGKDRTPLLVLPLEKNGEKQELPLEFTVSIEGNDQAILNIQVQGKHRARLRVGALTD